MKMQAFTRPNEPVMKAEIREALGLPDNWDFAGFEFTSPDEVTIKLSRKPIKNMQQEGE